MTEVSIRPGVQAVTVEPPDDRTRPEKVRKGRESDREKIRGRRTVESCVHTSDVSERMRPSQSDVRREYKSRRVIHPSVCSSAAACTYAHAREPVAGHVRRRTVRARIQTRRGSKRSSSCSCFSSSRTTAVRSSAFRSPSFSLFIVTFIIIVIIIITTEKALYLPPPPLVRKKKIVQRAVASRLYFALLFTRYSSLASDSPFTIYSFATN